MTDIPGRSLPRFLDPASIQHIQEYVLNQQNPDGGFRGRSPESDLYYTVFGLTCLAILQMPIPATVVCGYLDPFGDGANLDFVHLTCLSRCWGFLTQDLLARPLLQTALAKRLAAYQCADGAFHRQIGQDQGLAYESFLAVQAHLSLQLAVPRATELCAALQRLRTADHAFANTTGAIHGTTTVTAAVVMLWRLFGHELSPQIAEWLLERQHPHGGFTAHPNISTPDLLATATALQALAVLHRLQDVHRPACLHFVEHLWTDSGGFCGHWNDPMPDCEYTFYGLLALDWLAASGPLP
ncbi:MAG TPA: prenyltransferase/squalene oxidase repeat-containing protein [Candidatus Paceibacterota bacterium]|nr:prenyltransferase/squalene oxidase repeat-containing protein [Verrucomicrobiota bacterium]HRY47110.1 prenyltransferase/squalene oxidase repeat-containing protein [Candidatus Paceibacterota bacterium]HSA02633.1 prenyltransferase/squalene oxidase repeat-containing protein [Candidatus Paceibacterota bacterium]